MEYGDTPHILVLFFIILVCLVFIITDNSQRFFLLVICAIAGYFYWTSKTKTVKKQKSTLSFVDNIEKELNDDHEISLGNCFYVHKNPRNLKYLKKHQNLTQIVYDIKFVQIYDRALYNKIVALIEYFLKIHYKVVLEKYDFSLYYGMLKDIRIELLNSMKSIHYNIPNISTITTIPNLDEFVELRIRMVQAITYKMLKLLAHKYNKPFHKPPHENDLNSEKHFALF